MKMLGTIIQILFLICLLFYVADTTIEFKPFKITVGSWHIIVGLLLIGTAVFVFELKGYKKGYKEGFTECEEVVFKELHKAIEANKAENAKLQTPN